MSSDGSDSEVMFLNRVLGNVPRSSRSSFDIEGCRRHADIIVSATKTKTVDTPENREGMEFCAGSRLLVSPVQAGEVTRQYRSLIRCAAYLGDGQSWSWKLC